MKKLVLCGTQQQNGFILRIIEFYDIQSSMVRDDIQYHAGANVLSTSHSILETITNLFECKFLGFHSFKIYIKILCNMVMLKN